MQLNIQSPSTSDSTHASSSRLIAREALVGVDLFDLDEQENSGLLSYVTTGNDPQMTLCKLGFEQPLEIEPGRYIFYFQARVTKGRIYKSRLYIDYGNGFSEDWASNVFLNPVSSDTWVGTIFTTQKIYKIRFDPSESNVNFTLIRMDIEVWGEDFLSPSTALYLTFRSIYKFLPFYLANSPKFEKIADFLSRKIFSRQLKLVHQHESAVSGSVAVPINVGNSYDERVSVSNLPDLYSIHYKEQSSVAHGARDPSFAPFLENQAGFSKNDPRLIAFYLPQFHPFAENDAWWGRGFTEWTNVSKAVPQFTGHYQPRLPGELGFYDLRLPEVMARQISLAKNYGLSGFCFHYYWFAGKRLLEKPLEMLLENNTPEFDFPFCICWANENWTRRWDGADQDILMKQDHSRSDHEKVFMDLFRYMSDSRYIKVDKKPVILVYRPTSIPEVTEMVQIWRDLAEKNGLPGIYLVATTAFGFSDPESIGFDALCQFPPHAVAVGNIDANLDMLNPNFSGNVYDYGETTNAYLEILEGIEKPGVISSVFPGVMTGWDNEARKPGRGHVFHNATPALFYNWLSKAIDWSSRNNKKLEQFVFINAWNEWAEGTYLEPDRKFGYAYLQTVSAVRSERLPSPKLLMSVAETVSGTKKPTCDAVICLHIFYEDLIDEFALTVATARAVMPLDVIVSVPSSWKVSALNKLIRKIDPVRVVITENRGRDIWPFIQTIRIATDLGYIYGCKIHSKKSTHIKQGDIWRRGLLENLLSPSSLFLVMSEFHDNPKIGIAAPKDAFFSATDENSLRDNQKQLQFLLERFAKIDIPLEDFAAGTMFWFRFAALQKIVKSDLNSSDFGPELGAIDGTVAHAFERIFPTLVKSAGFCVNRYLGSSVKAPY